MRLAALIFAALLLAVPAQAAEVFVVEAKGIELAPGQALDGVKPLVLAVGQKVTLVTDDGRTIKLKGPSEAPPVPPGETAQGDLATSLKGLLKARAVDTASAGVIRSGESDLPPLPQPWLVDIRRGGDRCVKEGEAPVLYRGQGPAPAEVEIQPADQSWRARAPWPQGGSPSLELPPSVPLHGGQTYRVALDKATVTITIHAVPARLNTDLARAAWMLNLGCQQQVDALAAAE